MLVGGVVRHPVDEHAQPAFVGVGQQVVEVGERAEDGVHVAVVAHVVAEVRHRRAEERREPDGVHAEPRQVVEMAPDSLEIPDAVAVRVRVGAGIELFDHRRLPPGCGHGGPA